MPTKRRDPQTHDQQDPASHHQGASATEQQQSSPDLQARVAELEKSIEDKTDHYIRMAADFDNFRKRARQEQLDVIQHASQRLIEALLPVLDDLHLTLEHAPPEAAGDWIKGLELSVQKLEDVLAAQGVRGIESAGERFDPKLHEAVGSDESDLPEDTVVQELRRGYRMHDRVLRPSLVRVARKPSAT